MNILKLQNIARMESHEEETERLRAKPITLNQAKYIVSLASSKGLVIDGQSLKPLNQLDVKEMINEINNLATPKQVELYNHYNLLANPSTCEEFTALELLTFGITKNNIYTDFITPLMEQVNTQLTRADKKNVIRDEWASAFFNKDENEYAGTTSDVKKFQSVFSDTNLSNDELKSKYYEFERMQEE